MAHINMEQENRLIEAENYFWEHSDWKENKETERALWCLWSVLEEIDKENIKIRKKMKKLMREKRAENKDYGRNYKKSEEAMQREREYRRKYYLTVVKPRREAQKGKK